MVRSTLLCGGRLVVAVSMVLAVTTVGGLALLRAQGEQILIVNSGSMEPTFAAGDAVVVTPPDALEAGMIVAFHDPGDAGRLTTHRIASLRPMDDGLFIQTKGDANATADPNFTPAGSVVGVMNQRLPMVGRWLVFFQSPVGRAAVLGTPLVTLMVSEAAALLRLRRRSRLEDAALASGGRSSGGLVAATVITVAISVAMGVTVQQLTAAAYTAAASTPGNTFATRSSFCSTATAYRNAVTADSPGRWYRLGEASGTTADDATTTATTRNGTYRNTPALGVGGAFACDTDTAVRLNGSNHHVTTGDLQTNPTTFSIEAWFKTTTGGGKIVGFGNAATGTSSRYDRHIYLSDSGQVVFGTYTGAVNTVISPATYLDDNWHHVVATIGSSGMRLYVDGTLRASNANTGSENFNGYWRIGFDNLNGWGPTTPSRYHFTGTIDDVAIYPTQLTATRVQAHYTAAGA